MIGLGLRSLILLSLISTAPLKQQPGSVQKDQAMLNQAKILMMEQKWEDARQAFQRLIREAPQSALLPQAYYHSAYCLRLQKKREDALLSYELFRQKYPREPFLAVEAGKAVVDLSIAMIEEGKPTYRNRLVKALADPEKDVRYLAAIRCSYLKDRELNRLCVPILKEIRVKEKEPDLLMRASIALLKIDPAALAQPESPKQAKAQSKTGETPGRMFHIQIFEAGENKPASVEMSFPLSFAQLAIAALDESTKAEMRRKGFDVDDIRQSLNRLNPVDILTLRNGPRVVKIWIR